MCASPHRCARSRSHTCAGTRARVSWTRTHCWPRVFQQHPHPAPPLFLLTAATEGNGNFCREGAWSCCLCTGALPGSGPAMPTLSRGGGGGVRGAGWRRCPPSSRRTCGQSGHVWHIGPARGSWPRAGRAAGDGKRAPAWKGMKGGSQLRTPDATCPGAREGSGMSLSHGQIAIRRRR